MSVLRRSYDLAAIVAVAILALLLGGVASGANPLLVAVGLPLVLFAPGYALSAVLAPDRSLGLAERVLLSIGVSVAVAVIGGLLLNLLPGPLNAGLWRAFLAGFTLFAGAYGLWRRGKDAHAPAPGPLVIGVSVREASLAAGGALLIGLALGLGAVGVSPTSSSAAGADRFTQFWAAPAASSGQRVIRVGLRNYEDEAMVYRVTLEASGNVFAEWPQVTVKNGGVWQAQAAMPGNLVGRDVIANAYRAGDATPYRHVRVAAVLGGGE